MARQITTKLNGARFLCVRFERLVRARLEAIMETTFEKLPAVDGSVACLTCGCGALSDLDMNRRIGVGFGSAGYSKDGKTLWEECGEEFDELPSVQQVEEMAQADPNHDWRIFFFAPLYEAEYQRQGEGVWVLVRKDVGFA